MRFRADRRALSNRLDDSWKNLVYNFAAKPKPNGRGKEVNAYNGVTAGRGTPHRRTGQKSGRGYPSRRCRRRWRRKPRFPSAKGAVPGPGDRVWTFGVRTMKQGCTSTSGFRLHPLIPASSHLFSPLPRSRMAKIIRLPKAGSGRLAVNRQQAPVDDDDLQAAVQQGAGKSPAPAIARGLLGRVS